MEPVLTAVGVSKRFGGVTALDDVALDLYPGEVHALVGENGAGKSTLIKVLTGAYHADEGEITYLGETVSLSSPRDAWDIGISTTFQEITLVPLMSVARNLYLGNEPRGRWGLLAVDQMNATADRTVAPLRHRHRRSPPGAIVRCGRATDDRHRACGVDRCTRGHPRRADGIARAARDRAGLRCHRSPEGGGSGTAVRQSQPRRGVRHLGPHHDPS